jgi:hypothetical protein
MLMRPIILAGPGLVACKHRHRRRATRWSPRWYALDLRGRISRSIWGDQVGRSQKTLLWRRSSPNSKDAGSVAIRLVLHYETPEDPADPSMNCVLAAATRPSLPVNLLYWAPLAPRSRSSMLGCRSPSSPRCLQISATTSLASA